MVQGLCPLASLPHELLLYQVAFFQDLRSHLTFSLTCRRIYVLYDEHLWRRISISSGLGKPFDLTFGEVSWRRLCATAVAHGRVCRLHDCSEVALSRGRDMGLLAPPRNLVFRHQSIHAEDIELHLSPVFEGLNGDLEDFYSSSIPCGPMAKSWMFQYLFQKSRLEGDLLGSITLPATHTSEQMVTKLAHHLPASCALATIPAVDRLDLDIGQYTIHVRNKDGVCIWDVVSAIARKMLEMVPSAVTNGSKTPMLRIYQVISREWQQYVLLRFSLHGRGSINVHLDIGEEISVSTNTASP